MDGCVDVWMCGGEFCMHKIRIEKMIFYRDCLLLFLCYACFSVAVLAQKKDTGKQRNKVDGEFWTGVYYKHKFNKSWDIALKTQVRLKSIVREFDRALLEVQGAYNPRFHSIVKPMSISFGGRYIFHYSKRNDRDYHNYFRLFASLSYKIEVKRLEVECRALYQNQVGLEDSKRVVVDKNIWAQDIRARIKVSYDFKKWKLDPEIWYEMFVHDEIGDLDGFTKYRIGLGCKYKFDKRHSLRLKYVFERETKYFSPKTTHIVSLSYIYVSKKKKRKK